MGIGWNGGDPTQDIDPDDYELAVEYIAVQDITITHIRVWAGPDAETQTARRGRIWSTAGGQLGIATLPDSLPLGWSQHALDIPVERLAGQRWFVSYTTAGNYGALVGALAAAVPSADGAVATVAAAQGTLGGNGAFNGTPGGFPTNASGASAFYGIDVVYDLGIGGNTAPRITQLTVAADGPIATAIVVAEDDQTMLGATYRYQWGDDSPDTVTSSATAQHTYAASGTYAVLVTVADAEGLADHAAAPVTVAVPDPEANPLDEQDFVALLDSLVDHALRSGRFERVNKHEPKNAPGHGISASVWLDTIEPAIGTSGLASTSGRIVAKIRCQQSALSEPADAIDPHLLAAVNALMLAYSDDFTLDGLIRKVDLLGEHRITLSARAGYLTQDHTVYRVMDITVPMIINDMWAQNP